MASSSDDIGGLSDQVTLRLNGSDVLIAESYEVRQSYFEQPSTFSITLGSGDVAKYFLQTYGPNIPFELRIGNIVQFVGMTTAIEANGNASATTVTIHGRDGMSALIENKLEADKAFSNATYSGLIQDILTFLGISFVLVTDQNQVGDNRKKAAGVPVQVTEIPPDLADILSTALPQKPQVQGKAGETVYHYLKRELDRAGLFLYCGVNGQYYLSAPARNQAPACRIARQRGASPNLVNVIDYRFRFDTVGRSARYVVVGRGGGAPTSSGDPLPDELADLGAPVGSRVGIRGEYVDPEMVELGFTNVWVKRDKHVTSSKQAEYLARKMGAQAARHQFELTYKVSGHTIPALAGGRMVWSVDTIVDVRDDELGIAGPMWVESVTRRRDMGGGTMTEVKLLKPDYLIFGLED
jgi:prophage tail gpP-like protein